MDDFAPCPGCHRHVRAAEARCPFCAADTRGVIPLGFDPALAAPRVRHAVLALGAALAIGACQSQVAAVYGGPPLPEPAADAAMNAPPPSPAPIYGGPPDPGPPPPVAADASTPPPPAPPVRPQRRRPRPPEDFGAPVPAYGVPPPRDPNL